MNKHVQQGMVWVGLSVIIPISLYWIDAFTLKGAVIIACIAVVINVGNCFDAWNND